MDLTKEICWEGSENFDFGVDSVKGASFFERGSRILRKNERNA